MALLTSLMAILLMLALSGGLTLTTMTESSIAANHRDGVQTLYTAEAGIDLAISRLRTIQDWNTVAAAGTTTFVVARLVDVVQTNSLDSRFGTMVTVSPDPNGNRDVLVLESMAAGPGGNRRSVQVTIMRLPPDAQGVRAIETILWR
ncbi:MAG TPA: hypothetical protein VL693_17230 [Vicinamibacterales bacterium]|jgi:hypothetical protein|nr:hypothetical protein [Vicinamibacterales bacterium]